MVARRLRSDHDGRPAAAIGAGALRGRRPSLAVGVTVAALAVAVSTVAIWPLRHIAPVFSLSVVYLPAVLLVSIYWGPALGLATALGRRRRSTSSTTRPGGGADEGDLASRAVRRRERRFI